MNPLQFDQLIVNEAISRGIKSKTFCTHKT